MLKETYKDGQQDWYSNESYQRVLADNLIKFLGYDSAIDACYDHEWMETLSFIKSRKSNEVCH